MVSFAITAKPYQDVHGTSQFNLKLFLDPTYSDYTFIVENERIPAHKGILVARNPAFESIFAKYKHEYTVRINDKLSFKRFLKYLYTGCLKFDNLTLKDIICILRFTYYFSTEPLQKYLIKILEDFDVTLDNCIELLKCARCYGLTTLKHNCNKYIDLHASEILELQSFQTVSENALIDMLKRDSFYVDELKIFNAICKWSNNNAEKAKNIIPYLRLSLISQDDVENHVKPSNVIYNDVLYKTLQDIKDGHLVHSPRFISEINYATVQMGAQIIKGKSRKFALSGEHSYDDDYGFTFHYTTDGVPGELGIMVELKNPTLINKIYMLLNDYELEAAFKYYIEVSTDYKNWTRVVDYSKYWCRADQHMRFNAIKVKYINIVGTRDHEDLGVFQLVNFEAWYTHDMPDGYINYIESTLPVVRPNFNVTCIDENALVYDSDGLASPACIINGKYNSYSNFYGFTSFYLDAHGAFIRFAQPYMISSLQFLLLDYNSDAFYSYRIYTWNHIDKYKLLVDKSNVKCKSWQAFRFKERLAHSITIVGTASSNAETIDIVHVESPIVNNMPDVQVEEILDPNTAKKQKTNEVTVNAAEPTKTLDEFVVRPTNNVPDLHLEEINCTAMQPQRTSEAASHYVDAVVRRANNTVCNAVCNNVPNIQIQGINTTVMVQRRRANRTTHNYVKIIGKAPSWSVQFNNDCTII